MSSFPKRDEIKRAVIDSVNELIVEFQRSPYLFLYEEDLQATLFGKLRARLPGSMDLDRSGSGAFPYRLGWVYTEYNGRVDIACLDPERVWALARVPHKGFDTYIYNLPMWIGIELKYRKMGDRLTFESCLADLKKLRGHAGDIPVPFVLAFVQDQEDVHLFMNQASELPGSVRWGAGEVAEVSELDAAYVVSPQAILRVAVPTD